MDDVCKLTGLRGRFVRSHLIPAALTERGSADEPLYHNMGPRPVRRRTSWYDEELVTADGERILAAYDSWAISELRRLKLIWSSWGPMLRLSTHDYRQLPFLKENSLESLGWGYRRIQPINPAKLRMFFLSLLWRAAESTRFEFEEVAVTEPQLSTLRSMILNGDANPLNVFPIELIQISTRGVPHNFTPLAIEKPLPTLDGSKEIIVPCFRFYLDGLVIHFDRRTDKLIGQRRLYQVGDCEELLVVTIPNEDSTQHLNLIRIMSNELQDHPACALPSNFLRT